ncbi:hypothetical protein GRI97_14625 [Altererythrobacter xixiisoli]|uniref:SMP-30/Gluconolactonase/LRE-like region domain-containing protein n=2 Tax=Croceibacterium xixiisoli TaxID=1476466 RepID=A0A6I4TVJ8_9SPHN|nr:hypothetical protein [Croceibacterium xixiisoli]
MPYQSARAGLRRSLLPLAAILMAGCATAELGAQQGAAPRDIPIAGTEVFPESITSDQAGNLYLGSGAGIIYRAQAGAAQAVPWIRPDAANGLQSLFGVLAHDSSGLLWVCSNPDFFAPPAGAAKPSALKAFRLSDGKLAASHDFPAGPAACNDIAIAADGTVFATETSGGRIFALKPGGATLDLFAAGENLIGVDGIAFADDGAMYINNVRANQVQRVRRKADGSYDGLTNLVLSQAVDGPDGLRPVGGNRFLQAEGTGGRVTLVDIQGDRATITTIRDGLGASASITRVGRVGYTMDGKIGYKFDPALKGKDPGAFTIQAFLLPDGV